MPRHFCLALMLAAGPHLPAQLVTHEVSARLPAPPPLFDGFDAAVTVSGAHDSYLGWYNVVTPAISYTFSRRLSADLSMSIYPYRLAASPTASATAIRRLIPANGNVGDMLLELHGDFTPGHFRDVATASMTFPTGDRSLGLGTGQMTVNFDNRLERYVGKTGLLVDVGGGDSSAFQNRIVTEDDSSLGSLAQFQTGIVNWLGPNISVQSVAYEQLPIGDQRIYTITNARRPQTVVSGRRVVEDNGFNTTVNMLMSEHIMLTSTYNRSLRLHLDTVSAGVTFTLRSLPFHNSLIDRAIREAERGGVESMFMKH